MNKKLWILLIAIVIAFVGTFIWYKFIRNDDEDDPENYADSYLVLDLHGTPEWLASHKATVTWNKETYTLPMAFKITEASPTNENLIGFKIHEDAKAVILTIAGNPVDVVSIPADEIGVLRRDSVFLDNVAGRSANVAFIVFAPKGVARDTYRQPDENKLRSLLTSSNMYNLTQKDWHQTLEKLPKSTEEPSE